jgi:hypothetical protein
MLPPPSPEKIQEFIDVIEKTRDHSEYGKRKEHQYH